MKRLPILAVALVVYGSLYPWHFDFSAINPVSRLLHSWPDHFDRFVARDVILNLILYFPVGLSLFLGLVQNRTRWRAIVYAGLLSLLLSTVIEFLQVYVPGRDPSMSDVTCNFMGGLAGALAAPRFQRALDARMRLHPARDAGAAAFLLGLWAIAQWYPFFPSLSQHQLHRALHTLWDGSIGPVEMGSAAAEVFAVALVLRALSGRLRGWWVIAAAGWFAGRLFIAARTVSLNELVGAVLAIVLWTCLRDDRRLRVGVALILLAIAARELAPFHFSPQAAAFSWIPFDATLTSDRESAVFILASKAFLYGVALWLMRQAGFGRVRSSLALASGLLICEILQIHLAGRTPETTDPVLTLIIAFALFRRET